MKKKRLTLFMMINVRRLYGARRDRTVDLLTASQTLSQLSYSPEG